MSKLAGAMTQAATYPSDVRLQLAAGFTAEAEGRDDLAVKYFDAAIDLGLPIDGKYEFYFSYGIALRKVGRVEESEVLLRHAIEEFPADKGFPVILAITLDKAGRSREAVGELLELLMRQRDVLVDVAKQKPRILDYMTELGIESSAHGDE